MAIVDLQQPSAGGRVIELDDPARRNALTAQMQEELRSAVRTVAEDASARALVIAGRGGSFCAGADLGELFGDRARRMDATRSTLHDVYRAFLAVRELPIPVVAAVEGPAVGAGVNLALACDVRIAGPTARLGVTFSRLGLHPGGGCTYFLVRELGRQRALAVLLGGLTLTAEEALSLGLVLEVADDPLDRAVELARQYAALDPALARNIKHTVDLATAGDFAQVLDFETWAQAASAESAEAGEAVARFAARSRL